MLPTTTARRSAPAPGTSRVVTGGVGEGVSVGVAVGCALALAAGAAEVPVVRGGLVAAHEPGVADGELVGHVVVDVGVDVVAEGEGLAVGQTGTIGEATVPDTWPVQ